MAQINIFGYGLDSRIITAIEGECLIKGMDIPSTKDKRESKQNYEKPSNPQSNIRTSRT